jgi:hypothetical protein
MVQKWAVLAVILVVFGALAHNSEASEFGILHPFDMTIAPITPLVKEAPISIKVTFSVDTMFYHHPNFKDKEPGALSARLFPFRDQGDTLYYESWPVQLDDTHSGSVTFPVTIPDNNVFVLEIDVTCGGLSDQDGVFFITVGEPMQFTHVLIDPPVPIEADTEASNASDNRREIDRDTLTEGQLDTKYKVLLDLKDPNHRAIAEKILGQMQEKNKSDVCPTCYALDVSLRNLFKLADAGLEIGFFNPPPWSPEYKMAPPRRLSNRIRTLMTNRVRFSTNPIFLLRMVSRSIR